MIERGVGALNRLYQKENKGSSAASAGGERVGSWWGGTGERFENSNEMKELISPQNSLLIDLFAFHSQVVDALQKYWWGARPRLSTFRFNSISLAPRSPQMTGQTRRFALVADRQEGKQAR